jgi:hypothetical protein
MGYEQSAPIEVEAEQVFDDAYFLDNMGLGPDETNVEIEYRGHVGTLGQALQDKDCPLRDMIADGYRDEGFDGTQKKLDAFSVLYGTKVTISDKTRSYHAGSVSRDSLLMKPEVTQADEQPKPPERADFLARLNLTGR